MVLCAMVALLPVRLPAQKYEGRFIAYNTLMGAVTGGIGAAINKHPGQSWQKTFVRGFVTGSAGGAICYTGKKLNFFIAQKHELGYAWLSRAVFSAGNSVVENAAANRPFWSQWHYDIGFVRLEYHVADRTFLPRFMPSTFGGFLFIMFHGGRFDAATSLHSGSLTFRTKEIEYAPSLVASTATNGFLLNDTLSTGAVFFETYAHEMIHAFQFQELSGVNYFSDPLTTRWKERSPFFEKVSRYVYGDLNYELFLANYFLIEGGHRGRLYCRNFLENEAEFLSVGRSACLH